MRAINKCKYYILFLSLNEPIKQIKTIKKYTIYKSFALERINKVLTCFF